MNIAIMIVVSVFIGLMIAILFIWWESESDARDSRKRMAQRTKERMELHAEIYGEIRAYMSTSEGRRMRAKMNRYRAKQGLGPI